MFAAMIGIPDLLAVTGEYIRVTQIKEVTLSFRVFGDSKKLKMLREGADITLGKFNAALLWLSTNWPEGAEWPRDVPRPIAEAAE
ncbi:hypothetical protein [Mesorhizobium xinjiangense]|uniref:hypothetical protein n=1 Tax=Mesorhizobium xinjiangense TaxID=2678685 RepID=UPI0012EDAA18|nr:hypothetical protein [Mesorhizobium xinjiangense]